MNVRPGETPAERVKQNGCDLCGSIAEELATNSSGFSVDNVRLLKHHGIFQHDNRDERGQGREKDLDRRYEFMVRIRATGGKLNAIQLRGVMDLADELCDGQVHITSRQGMQLDGIAKSDLRLVVRRIADLGLSTIGAGGDLNANVMCCPAPRRDNHAHDQLRSTAEEISARLMPRATAYEEIWLDGRSSSVPQRLGGAAAKGEADSLYGKVLLPHKFKIAIAAPEDNCTDVYAQDVGLLAATDRGHVVGYNVLVGGSMGTILGARSRFPALARPMAFVRRDEVLPLVTAVVRVYWEFGDRSDRSKARLKYLIYNWGLERFKQAVEERLGRPLEPPHPTEVVCYEDHLGWNQQGDGNWYVGIHVDGGAICDGEESCLRSALREIADRFACEVRLTPQQNILFCDIAPAVRTKIEALLEHHNVLPNSSLSLVRRYALACSGLPNCSAAITESSRVLPGIVDALETEVARLGLSQERFTVRVTGCSFGCTRSYLADIALVGRTVDLETRQDKYAIFVGGETLGRRLNTLYKDLVPADQIIPTLRPLLHYYKKERHVGETLGTFCFRKGVEDLKCFARRAESSDRT